MSSDKENAQREIANDDWEEETNILMADARVLDGDSVKDLQRNSLDIAQEANQLASVAIWIAVLALVISVVGALVSLFL